MADRRLTTIRYRCPYVQGVPQPGAIIMGTSDRTRRAYRVLSATKARGIPSLGVATWRLHVEPMSVASGRQEIASGMPHWTIKWDRYGTPDPSVARGSRPTPIPQGTIPNA